MTTHYRKRHSRAGQRTDLSKRLGFLVSAFVLGYLSASLLNFQQLSIWLNTHSPFEKKPSVQSEQLGKSSLPPKPKLEFYTLLTSSHESTIPATPVHSQTPNQQLAQTQTLTLSTQSTSASLVEHPGKEVNSAVQPTAKSPISALAKTIAGTAPISRPANQTKQPISVAIQKPKLFKPNRETNLVKPSIDNRLAYTLQVAAFRVRQDAEHLKASLLLKGYGANIIAINNQHITWFRVVVGPFSSREQAVRTQLLLSQRERINGMLRKMDA